MVPAVTGSLANLYNKHQASSESLLSAAWNLFGGSGQKPEKDRDAFTPPGKAIDDSIRDFQTP